MEHKRMPFNSLRPRQNERHFTDDIFKCIFFNENVWIPIKISLKFVSQGPINNIPALVQIIAWRQPGDKPLSEPMMVRLLTYICVTRPHHSLHARFGVSLTHWGRDKNGQHYANDIFKWIFLNENVWFPIKISLKFVPKGLINNIPALVQIMAWRRPGDKTLSEPMMVILSTHICVTLPQWVNSPEPGDTYMHQ